MHLRKSQKKQARLLFSNVLIPVHGHRWLEPFLVAQGYKVRTNTGQQALPSQGHSHSHTHSGWDKLDMPINLSLGCGRRLSPKRKPTHTRGEYANSTLRVSLAWVLIFF